MVLRSPIHANEDYDLYSIVKYSVGCAVEHAFVFTWLICMNGTSQYHHYRKLACFLSRKLNVHNNIQFTGEMAAILNLAAILDFLIWVV